MNRHLRKSALNINQSIKFWFVSGIISVLLVSCSAVTNINLPSSLISRVKQANSSSTGQSKQIHSNSISATLSTPSTTPNPAASMQSTRTTNSHSRHIVTGTPTAIISPDSNPSKIKTVFLIVMENHNWSDILNSLSAPYINHTLLPQASYASQYYNPSGSHPSEPNYLWLEAGTNFGITNDASPKSNHQSSTDHLVTYLDKVGVTWKAYQEDISGKVCPLTNTGLYAAKHNPMIFFDNVTDNNTPNSSYCISHERPFSQLQSDLQNGTVARYNFITPNLCNDMHNTDGCESSDAVKNGDNWLSHQVPMIMASQAYKQGGVIFITWDESENGDHPIGMIVLSPFAKGNGYSNNIHYTHSSTIRTIEEVFNVTPLLGDASNATDLSDLFTKFP
jgi:phosphatidylinositol-3-phosphatase